jgi:hypothetical protein
MLEIRSFSTTAISAQHNFDVNGVLVKMVLRY